MNPRSKEKKDTDGKNQNVLSLRTTFQLIGPALHGVIPIMTFASLKEDPICGTEEHLDGGGCLSAIPKVLMTGFTSMKQPHGDRTTRGTSKL